MKWFPFIVLAISPCWGATLRGVVTNAKGHHLASAEVTVFNELAPIFVQVGKTDSNGNYHFKVGAGLYRIFIVKKDYVPQRERVTIVDHDIVKNLVHQLTDMDLDENHYTKILKEIYRQTNREPYRDVEQGYSLASNLNRRENGQLLSSLSSQSQSSLNGSTGRTHMIQVGTQLNDHMAIDSRFARLHSGLSQTETQRIEADFSLNHRGTDMDLQAEALQQIDSDLDGQSHRLAFAGRYGDRFKAETALNFAQSELVTDQFQALSVYQDVRYRMGLVPVNQSLNLSNWRRNHEDIGQKTELHSDFTLGPMGRWGMAGDFQELNLVDDSYRQTTGWITRKQRSQLWPVVLENNLGILHHDDGHLLLQNHLLQATTHRFEITAQYEVDQQFTHFSSRDIFGNHLANPATPFASETFLQNRREASSLLLGLPHLSGWRSELAWQKSEDDAKLLASHSARAFNQDVLHQREAWTYRLDATPWGSQLEIAHTQHETSLVQFDQFMVSYSQWVRPFRDKSRGIMLALQMGNQPNVPAWWLLEEMPWDTSESGNWYEGQLRVQF